MGRLKGDRYRLNGREYSLNKHGFARRSEFMLEAQGETEMTFDYRLRPGPATSRNAIRLLGLLGFPETVVEGAQRRAEDFLREGRWRREK